MAIDADTFILEYSEFEPIHSEDADLVERVVARADRRVSVSWTAETREDMVFLVAADMLAKGPWGRNARLSEPGKPTAYACEIRERKLAYAMGLARIVE